MKQKTIKKAFSINGKGLHSGKEVSLTCQPALADYGIRFQRTDLEGEPPVFSKADEEILALFGKITEVKPLQFMNA